MLYTLIIVTSMAGRYDAGVDVTYAAIPGFSTEQACLNAANKIPNPTPQEYFNILTTKTCVPMDV